MALRPHRVHLDSKINYFMNETAERGGVVVQSTSGSGVAMDQAASVASYAAAPSGKRPLGILMGDVVNVDLTRQRLNENKEETQIYGKVTIWSKGTVVTNMIYPGVTPTAGATAYLAHSGLLHTSDVIGGNQLVGRFDSTKDEDGYARVDFNLP